MGKLAICLTEVLALLFIGLALVPASDSDGSAPAPSVTSTSVTHINLKSSKSFDAVTAAMEKQLGRMDAEKFASAMKPPLDAARAESQIRAMEGSSGLMLFVVRDHGQLLALKGKEALARQYEIGNPLVALEMTQENIVAGEYAPLRIYVYAGDDNLTHIDYDLPSSVFGRFKSSQVDKVAKGLDQKLEILFANAMKD
jgi:uncharacterized protein (DUF302 family)